MVIYGNLVPSATRLVRGAAKHALTISGLRHCHESPFAVPARAGGFLAGGPDQLLDLLGQYARHGLQEAVFKHERMDSDTLPEYLADSIVPIARGISG